MLKPNKFRKKKVPTIATITDIPGIKVERQSCKNTNTTMNTRINASIMVVITFEIEASKNSLAFTIVSYFNPGGKLAEASSRTARDPSITSCALDPAVWFTIIPTDGYPLVVERPE